MSFAKRLLEEQYNKSIVAEEIAVRAGVLGQCEFHECVYDNYGDPVDAYKLANAKFTAGEISDVFANRHEMTDYIKAVIEESADECGYCAKIARE